jgi:hypothetical protein
MKAKMSPRELEQLEHTVQDLLTDARAYHALLSQGEALEKEVGELERKKAALTTEVQTLTHQVQEAKGATERELKERERQGQAAIGTVQTRLEGLVAQEQTQEQALGRAQQALKAEQDRQARVEAEWQGRMQVMEQAEAQAKRSLLQAQQRLKSFTEALTQQAAAS